MITQISAFLSFLRHTLLDQLFDDVYSPVECLPIIISDIHTAIEPATTLRGGIDPLKPIALPENSDVTAIDVCAGWILGGKTTKDGLKLIDQSIGVCRHFDMLRRVRLKRRSSIIAYCGGEKDVCGI